MECVIVDDEQDNLIICEKHIRKLGIAPRVFNESLAALDYCVRTPPSFIILDWYMPKMNGIEFLEKLDEALGEDRPPVIMCTGETQKESVVDAISKDGIVGYMVKPFSRSTLANQLIQIGILRPKDMMNKELMNQTIISKDSQVRKLTF